jgi:hypothetical protein
MSKRISEDWEFNVLNVYNFHKAGHLEGYFDFVRENHAVIEGDLLEAGVFRGSSLIGMALMLKELGSDKKIYGYDTWSGFPPIYRPEDGLEQWEALFRDGRISARHLEKTRLQAPAQKKMDSSNISLSGDFSSCSRADVQRKLDYLELDNVVLVEGDFAHTMAPGASGAPAKLMAAIIDADLYASYQVSLPFCWSKLVHGGYLYLDEYYSLKFPGARIASDEFFATRRDKPQRHAHENGHFERWFVRKLFDTQSGPR